MGGLFFHSDFYYFDRCAAAADFIYDIRRCLGIRDQKIHVGEVTGLVEPFALELCMVDHGNLFACAPDIPFFQVIDTGFIAGEAFFRMCAVCTAEENVDACNAVEELLGECAVGGAVVCEESAHKIYFVLSIAEEPRCGVNIIADDDQLVLFIQMRA